MNNEDIIHFKDKGYVVVENVFSESEVSKLRKEFHNDLLLNFNINHNELLLGNITVNNIRKKSPVSKLFYSDWKLNAQLNKKVYNLSFDLLNNTFLGNNISGFKHQFEGTNKIIPFIDRVCYRTPDNVFAEGGLKLHIDRNPTKPYCGKYFRPIQSFICLTNHYTNFDGGLQLVPGFHKQFDNYFKGFDYNQPGDFFRMESHKYESLYKKLETIYAPAGSVVYWDNRLPHKTCEYLSTNDTREVIYFSYLPYTELNKKYLQEQYNNLINNISPPAFNNTNLPNLNKNINLLKKEYKLLNPENY